MATVFGARSRFVFAPDAAASADVAHTIVRRVTRAYDALNGAPRADAPCPFPQRPENPTSACWILHAR